MGVSVLSFLRTNGSVSPKLKLGTVLELAALALRELVTFAQEAGLIFTREVGGKSLAPEYGPTTKRMGGRWEVGRTSEEVASRAVDYTEGSKGN